MPQHLIVNDKIEAEKIIKVAPFKKDIRKTTAHKHNNYFEIIYLSQGSGYHYIDLNQYLIAPPVMFFVRQEQVHYWELDNEPDGYVVIIRKSFVEKSLDRELKSLLVKISSQCCLQLSDIVSVEKLFGLLADESRAEGMNWFQITEGLPKSLMAKVLDVSQPITYRQNHKTDLFQSFIQLLSADNGIKNKVAYYAEKLNTTPQNLNAACRKSIKKAAAEVLAEFVLNEAKRLLLYTDNTVSEISFALGFENSSYFVKYFKKLAGCTPKAFRTAGAG